MKQLRTAILTIVGCATLAAGQSVAKIRGPAIYVADFGSDPGAATARERLIDAILNRSNAKIVPSKEDATAVLTGSVSTNPVTRFGAHLEDLKGNILWAFDEAKCGGNWLTKPVPGTPMWESVQRASADSGRYACAAKQLTKAIEQDRKTKR